MIRRLLAPSTLRRRGGVLVLALALVGAGWTVGNGEPSQGDPGHRDPGPGDLGPVRRGAPRPCGTLDGFGFVSEGALVDDALRATWTLVAAPVETPVLRPLVFVDGILAADFGPVAFPCERPVVIDASDLVARDAVHWLLHGWPPVPSELAALRFEEARARYAGRRPPGTFALADVGFDRPVGGRPRPTGVVAAVAGGALVEDRVEVPAEALPEDGRDGFGAADRLLRASVGVDLPVRIVYAASDSALVLATCLLNGVQLPAFAGAPTLAARLEPGRLLVLDGTVRMPGPGWHRLHCLLLPDDTDPRTPAPPRPLEALYLWGAVRE